MVDKYGYSPVGWGRIVTLVYAGGLVLSAFLIALAALTISRALESSRPKARYYVTTPTYLSGFLRRILPTRMLDRVVARG